jgi:hypothetical protein
MSSIVADERDLVSSPLLAAALSLGGPGLGHAYCRDWPRAILFLLLSLGGVVAAYFFAGMSAWMVAFGVGVLLVFNFAVAADAFRVASRAPRRHSVLLAGLYIVAAVLAYGLVCKPMFRVEFFANPSTMMKPTLLPGDHFAIDRFYTDFKVGDVVTVEYEDRTWHVRRIQKLNPETVIVATDSTDHMISEDIPRALLRGKVLYVLYSIDPETSRPEWSRFFMDVK